MLLSQLYIMREQFINNLEVNQSGVTLMDIGIRTKQITYTFFSCWLC